MKFTSDYWNERYIEGNTGWDTGSITTPIKEYIDQLSDKNLKILIPGAGNAHEAAYLLDKGFNNTYVCDWAETAINNIKTNIPYFPENQLWCKNFFDIEEKFDLIIEQTFFCAIDPSLRTKYAQKVAQLLQQNGKLVGLLFDLIFPFEGPPFGGTSEEYENYFKPYFNIKEFSKAYNSIKPRAHNELFINLIKREL